MALGMTNGPHCLVLSNLVMGEDAAAGCAYQVNDGVLTKATSTTRFAVYPSKLAKNGEQVDAYVLSGGVPALLGTGGGSEGDPMKYDVNGTVVVGTVGTDHIIGYLRKTGIATAICSMTKIA